MSTKTIANICHNVVNFVSSSSTAQKSALFTAGLACLIALPFVANVGKEAVYTPIHGCSAALASKFFPRALTSQVIDTYPAGQTRDTLVVWGKLASKIGISVYFHDDLGIEDQFNSWITQHKMGLSSMKELDLNNCSLTTLPPQIGQLYNLEVLDLSDNQLSTLPPDMHRLGQLRYLNLSKNKFTALPPVVSQLYDLQTLQLQDNRLTQLPSELSQLTLLEILDLSWNNLTEIPSSLASLPANCNLTALGNQLSEKTTRDFQHHITQVKTQNGNQGPHALLSPRREILTLKTF